MSVVHWVVLIQHRIIKLIILVDDDGDLSARCEGQLNSMSRVPIYPPQTYPVFPWISIFEMDPADVGHHFHFAGRNWVLMLDRYGCGFRQIFHFGLCYR